jgi:CRISPR-associated protein Csy1
MDVQILSKKIEEYIQGRLGKKLNELEKNFKKAIEKNTDAEKISEANDKYKNDCLAVKTEHLPDNWLTKAAAKAKEIQLVTHALKFTHTDAKGSNIYDTNSIYEEKNSYLSTASLSTPELDITGNAAALYIAPLLQLSSEGKKLIDYLQEGDGSPLAPFSSSAEQLQSWVEGFQQVLKDKQPSSHTLAKQLYFPVNTNNDSYHLLTPLFATSFAHALYEKIADARYSELNQSIRKSRRNDLYHEGVDTQYPSVVVQNFGGTKPQNVSQLNSKRHGKVFLLHTAPPVWRKKITIPTQNIFIGEYNKRAKSTAWHMQRHLLQVLDKESNRLIRQKRADYVNNLIEILFAYVAQIHQLETPPGWSMQTKLSEAQKVWLDPYCEALQSIRSTGQWQQQIAEEFAQWLNNKLQHKQLTVGDVEYYEWAKILNKKLKEWE